MTQTIHHLCEALLEIEKLAGQQVAIELDEQSWTYAELLSNVICVSHELGIENGQIVGQCLTRSFEMICG